MLHRWDGVGHGAPLVRIESMSKALPRSRRIHDVILRPFHTEWRQVLRNISVDIYPGEVLGLVGPNGAGKSTLLRIICGLITADAGRVLVCGLDANRQWDEIKRRVGYVTADERSFYNRLTGHQNLEFYAGLQGLYGRRASEAILSCLEQVELTRYAHVPFMYYSSGMKQRLCIARGMLADPELLLLDEPTKSLDVQSGCEIRELVRQLCSVNGRTAIMASHNMQEVESVCDRVAVIANGTIACVGTISEIASRGIGTGRHTCKARVSGEISHLDALLASSGAVVSRISRGCFACEAMIELTMTSQEGLDSLLMELLSSGIHIDLWHTRTADLEAALVGVTNAS